MARFERSRERKRDSKSSSPRRDTRDMGSFGDSSTGRRYSDREPRYSDRESSRSSRNRRDFQMTKVTCASCGVECEVPFKPTSNKPVYCDDCFAKKGKDSSNKPSNRDLDIINEKLDKIIKILESVPPPHK